MITMDEISNEVNISFTLLENSVNTLSESQFLFKSNEKAWSILDCLEHICMTEGGILFNILLKKQEEQGDDAVHFGKEKIDTLMANRAAKHQAPDFLAPKGIFKSSAEVLQKITEIRQEIIAKLQSGEIVFDNLIFPHLRLGNFTKRDWLNFLIAHTERHRQQIEEIKQQEDFPKA